MTNSVYTANAEGVWAAGEVNNNMVVSEESRVRKFHTQHNLKSLVQEYFTQERLINS